MELGDILDNNRLAEVVGKGWDAVIHLAAFKAAGESMIVPGKYAVNNIAGTIGILNALVEADVGALVFSSSAAVFGEPEYLPIDEDHPKNPENFYGFTKLEIESLLEWYGKLTNIRFASLRYFNAAGYDPEGRIRLPESNPSNLIPVIMEVASGARPELVINGDDYSTPDGTCIRDYVHVTDLADAHAKAVDAIRSTGESLKVNLGSEAGISVAEIADAAVRITGVDFRRSVGPRRPGDPAKLVASSALARDLLGWIPRLSDVDSLIASSWALYQQ